MTIQLNQAYGAYIGSTVNSMIYQFHMIAFKILTGYLYFKYDHYNKSFKTIVKKQVYKAIDTLLLGIFCERCITL